MQPRSDDVRDLDEDRFTDKIPSRYEQYLEEDDFEKIKRSTKEWD